MPDTPLKPCPFCGSPARSYEFSTGDSYVTCTGKACGVSQRYRRRSRAESARAWNDRDADTQSAVSAWQWRPDAEEHPEDRISRQLRELAGMDEIDEEPSDA